ncbi:AAA ATPase midasin [Elasticomyces elasticus]|nr:AAA ATPase midasin [Elasticomyces elasticus]KAK4927902.1 AAA ATPase midasin [Elasticomyces elasticus]KAK5756044.1 AAA ATPase midasin [Elasticomyces elasticus]
MECSWDTALLQRGDQLPPELLQVLQHGTNEQYLVAITKASLDARYTYILFANCENIFAHVCASARNHGSLASALATIARILPFAPYLAPFATQLLREPYTFNAHTVSDDDLLVLLGIFRLLRHDPKAYKSQIDIVQIESLLNNPSRPVVYLAIRIMQIWLDGADYWFEEMIRKHLGPDSPESNIDGEWDDKIIDYRFITLWEEQRYEKIEKLLVSVREDVSRSPGGRTIPADFFHNGSALVSGIVLPTDSLGDRVVSDQLVQTPVVCENLARIATALKSPQPILLTGLAGSGKTLLTRYIANRLGKLEKMVTLHLNEQSDAKLLIGVYTTGDTPGSFAWKAGVLTTAVEEGRWVLIEDLDRAPNEILGTLLPLIERRELLIPNRKQTLYAAPGFRILATVRNTVNHRGEETRPLAHMLGVRHWQNVTIDMQPLGEQQMVAGQLFPSLSQLLPQFMAVYERLQASKQRAVLVGQTKTGVARAISPRDLLKWCGRVAKLLQKRTTFTSGDVDDVFMEAVDCFAGALPDGSARSSMAAVIAEELRIDPQRRDYLLGERDVRYEADKSRITMGRYSLPRVASQRSTSAVQSTFSTNPHTTRMLERVAAAVVNREPLLLVGETGVGKTTAVQHLATHLGKKLEPFNLSQQSEVGDLLGGFKPVTARSLIVPMKDEFDELFRAGFSMTKNQSFLELLGKQMARSNWKAVCKLWQQALKMVEQRRAASPATPGETPNKKRKVEPKKTLDLARWDAFAEKVEDMDRRLSAGNEAFAFSFVEGNIVRAVRNGDWVLLDEINLASPDTLESITDLLDPSSPSILLTEAGNIERIEAHPDFRIFAAMNPATDVGKKDLPPGIRSRFTELYVESPDKDTKSLQSIVRSYLRAEAAADPAIAVDVSTLYQKIIALSEQNKLVDGAGQKPHFSLRTLTRTLSYAKYIAPQCSLRRALYEGFQMSFLTFLDAESARSVQPLLEQYLLGKRTNIRSELQKALRKPNDGSAYVQGYQGSKHWVHQGPLEPLEQPQYILTPFIKTNLENLVRASSTRQFPVLIQGPTSSGKTSMIEYLAKRTGHKFVRINNHEHTDLQEYLGTYVSGTDGRLQFQEGVLVQALRQGHWLVLDELNLAPTDVLEALNRLLDDNRELLIPETQETIRPHGDFMLFATQNPAGLYGGRKTLSRAFRNRFLELHFDDIPVDELQEILHRRTQLPESRCKRIVTVYKELALLRQESRVFEQKSFATLRDLFRWAFRLNDTIEQLAANGYMLLAERVRKPEERQALKAIIEKALSANGPRVAIDEAALYSEESPDLQTYQHGAGASDVVWTKAMRRLYVLVSRAIQNNEPVVLVGETGCGKTTVCQMLADALAKQLHTVNAHLNTETGDLIGSQRPVRNRAAVEADLRSKLLASPPLQVLDTAAAHLTDALLSAYDQAVTSLDNLNKQTYCNSTTHLEIQTLRTRFKALFEWVDGSLVQAMRDGHFFLLDEISLADDSVLERINSVLEPQRSILLAEKGSLDSFVTASAGFQFLATMNPGGDYGKRELSPALRNRFTEIWVPALSDTEDIIQIVHAKLTSSANQHATAMVSFAQWFKDRYNTSASSSVSIRDTLAWVQFVNSFASTDVVAAIVHGAAMVYIDTLGANPAGLLNIAGADLGEERTACLLELSRLLKAHAGIIYDQSTDVTQTEHSLVVGPFAIRTRASGASLPSAFTFDAQTTRSNAMRVVRAMQLSKPVMLEGSPGVGKTALVGAIATAAGVPLTRINLSEQTDLLDLFGSDAPVEGAATGIFAWRDAPFLRAMKTGEWVLLDEMNLASQSVLEGLNACLDHRGEVFVPELGQTFTKHPDFRLFAAQNPHHQGGGRKGLPASFVNRFTVVYADAFHAQDLILICRRSFPKIPADLLEQAVRFVSKLDSEVVQRRRFGANGGPWEFNLRDISRWLALVTSDVGLLKGGSPRDFLRSLFTQRFRSASDQKSVVDLFDTVFDTDVAETDIYESISPLDLQLGLALLPRDRLRASAVAMRRALDCSPMHYRALESTMLCVQQRWPVVLTGSSGSGKTALIEGLAAALGASIVTIPLNADTDAMDLIGGYEQSDPLRQCLQALEQIGAHWSTMAKSAALSGDSVDVAGILANLQASPSELMDKITQLQAAATGRSDEDDDYIQTLRELVAAADNARDIIDKARFEWTDGLLVDALKGGKWLILDNANLCSPSVLDRLNSLLEQDGSLIVNEHTEADGSPRVIRPHPDFRVFLTVDPRHGELSRAMRNRAVEIYLPSPDMPSSPSRPLQPESAIARFRYTALVDHVEVSVRENIVQLARDHTSIADQQLMDRFTAQLAAGLYGQAQRLDLSTNLTSQDLYGPLTDFYALATSRTHASADLARVQVSQPVSQVSVPVADGKAFFQTLHPLNNHALVQQNELFLTQASTLASVYDFHLRLNSLSEMIKSCRTKQPIMRQLERTERQLLPRSGSTTSNYGLLAAVEATVQLALRWLLRVEDIPLHLIGEVRNKLHNLCGYLALVLEIITGGSHDAALFTACLSALREMAQESSGDVFLVTQTLMPGIVGAIASFAGSNIEVRGSACATLWAALKPTTPKSMVELHALLALEQVAQHFDNACLRFDVAIQTQSDTRITFARALATAKSGSADVLALSEHLGELVSASTKDAAELHGKRTPHFAQVFELLTQKAALLRLVGNGLPNEHVAAIELLASRATCDSILVVADTRMPATAKEQLSLLTRMLPTVSETGKFPLLQPLVLVVVEHVESTAHVGLRDLDLLGSESNVLCKIFASHTHTLGSDGSEPLDVCLLNLTTLVLDQLADNATNSKVQLMASQLLRKLKSQDDMDLSLGMSATDDRTPSDTPGFTQIQAAFRRVVDHLQSTFTDGHSHSISAAEAWRAFGMATLALYLPVRPFDPALQPRIERDVHCQTLQGIERQLSALRTFKAALCGEDDSLRSRTLEQDISRMGSEPTFEEISRPEVSAMSDLQAEFEALSRALVPFWHEEATQTDDDMPWANMERIRNRLEHQYRAYADLTRPIVALIDCMRVGRQLGSQMNAPEEHAGPTASLGRLIPFVNASHADWSQDDAFIELFSAPQGQQDTLLAMSVLAARSHACGIKSLSPALLDSIDQQFERLYDWWSHRLGEEQKRTAANSSLYRYQGDADQEDEASTAAEVDALFPGYRDPDAATAPSKSTPSHLTSEVAAAHSAIFRGHAPPTLVQLLERYTSLLTSSQNDTGAEHQFSAILWVLQKMQDRTSGISEATKSYNMYTDPNIREAQRLASRLHEIKGRFEILHLAWPEHATPVEVQRACDHILTIGHTEPLVIFLPLLEKLHATMTQWQQIASREFSINGELESITAMIVSWRQIELSSWAGLLDREDTACRTDASSWWYIAYENIIAAVRALQHDSQAIKGHTEGLLKTLGMFLGSCGLGEYDPRLNILRDFEAHLAALSERDPGFLIVKQALTNFIVHHERFTQAIAEKLAKGRSDLEKQIKSVIQVASWKDRNVETLKQSATSSHKRLLRLVRKYRRLLAQPVGGLLADGVVQGGPYSGFALIITKEAIAADEAHAADVSASQFTAWTARSGRFKNTAMTVSMMRTKAGNLGIRSASTELAKYSSDLRVDIQELQKQTPSILNEETKSVVQDLKRRKRRLLADVIREVQNMGFQRSMGDDVLTQQATLHAVLSRVPALNSHPKDSALAGAEHYFHGLLDILPSVRESARKHSDDLTPAEAARCMTLLESMLQASTTQRSTLIAYIGNASDLSAMLEQLHALASSDTLSANEAEQPLKALSTRVRSLANVLRTCTQLLRAQANLAGSDLTTIIQILEARNGELVKLEEEVRSEPTLPANISSDKAATLHSRFADVVESLDLGIKDCLHSYPETGTVLKHVQRWTTEEAAIPQAANGHMQQTPDAWISELLRCVDCMLNAVENVEKLAAASSGSLDQPGWLIRQNGNVRDLVDALQIKTIVRRFYELFAGLGHLAFGVDGSLTGLAAVCRSIWPIVKAFASMCQELLNSATSLHLETNKMAHQLAVSFLQLAQRGFCTPPDKADSKDQKAGEVETGTGLGDGEGGEDISKDVGDDEDLGELAQEPNAKNDGEDIADEKDAVDMADEEMEGALGEEPEGSDSGDGDGDDDAGAGDDIDEEAGSVDEQGLSTVDEKMWDDGANSEQPEKESKDMKDSHTTDDAAAAQDEKKKGEDETQQEDGASAEDAPGEDEHVQSQDMDQTDPHPDNQPNLDLPADIDMDGKDASEDGGSESDGMSEVGADADDAELKDAEGNTPEHETAAAEETGEAEQDDLTAEAEEPDGGDEASDEADDDEDARSDVLMEDDKDAAHADANDVDNVAEAGNGEDATNTEARENAQSTAQDQDAEGGAEEQDDPDATAAGDQESSRKQDSGTTPQKSAASESSLPYKQIGDVLEEWYRQHREIESAREQEAQDPTQPQDVDMSSARFEHVHDQNAPAETQALGTASADEATALPEDSGLPNNAEDETALPPRDDEDTPQEESEAQEPGMQIEPSEVARLNESSKAFVGEPQTMDLDSPMAENLPAEEEDQVHDVDQQLTDTHIDGDDNGEELSLQEARQLWSEHEASTRNLALVLTEHLRLILHPTQATKMRGDFRTGKRLNIKRIIPYIASSYKRDKIWMRRSVPSKRSYQIMLAIDDSKSMAESESKQLAFETVALVAKAMSMLEVGELSVVGFGENVNVAHDFSTPFTSDAGAQVFKQFSFAQSRTNVRKLLAESIEIFRSARLKAAGSASELWQLQLIISDGVCEDHPSIRQLVRQAQEERIMVVFVVVDAAAQKAEVGGPKQSILDLQTAEFAKDQAGEMQLKMVKYLDTFPFNYYLIVRDVQELPAVLAGALRQWLAEVMETGG